MKYCIDKSEFVVASGHIPVHMSQQNVANNIDNGYFSVNLVEGFGPKPSTQTPEYRRHSLMKLTSTINRFRDLFWNLILRLFEENFQKRNMLIIDRTRWEFGHQISGL